MVVEARLSDGGKLQVLGKVWATKVKYSQQSSKAEAKDGMDGWRRWAPGAERAYLNSLSSSMTCMPFSKLACPFWPAEAKWPFTSIFSGAVKDLLTVARRTGERVEECEDTGEMTVGDAMTTGFKTLVCFFCYLRDMEE